jgi:hypothetical protein
MLVGGGGVEQTRQGRKVKRHEVRRSKEAGV